MSEQKPNNGQPTQGWNTYWEGARDSDAFTSGGAGHPGFAAFWSGALNEFFAAHPDSRTLDIGTGSGAVIKSLDNVPGAELKNVSCVDISPAAIDGVKNRFPAVEGIVADANLIPLEPGQFDLITSQFGIEYAGPGALDEAARLLAPGGYLMFLLHYRGGVLHNHCKATIEALNRVRAVNFFTLCRTFFEAGFAAVRGADRGPYETAAKALNPVIRELESIMTQLGEEPGDVGDGTIAHLYDTLRNIHSRIQYYDPDEVLSWLDTADIELAKHLQRMESMTDCALDKATVEGIRTLLANKGLAPSEAQPLLFEGVPLPFAWALQATRV